MVIKEENDSMITYKVTEHKAIELAFTNPKPEDKDGDFSVKIKQIFSDDVIEDNKPFMAQVVEMNLTRLEAMMVLDYMMENISAKKCVGGNNE